MSTPKQLAKRQKLERKRRRKQESPRKRKRERQSGWCQPDWIEPFAPSDWAAGGVKMSDVLQDFVAPLAGSAEDGDAYERLLTLGLVAWNAALQPEHRREAIITDLIVNGLQPDNIWERHACRQTIDRLVARKLERFAEYQRPILSFQLDELDDGGYYLSVVSGLVG